MLRQPNGRTNTQCLEVGKLLHTIHNNIECVRIVILDDTPHRTALTKLSYKNKTKNP